MFHSYVSLPEGMMDVSKALVNCPQFYHGYKPWTYGWFIIALPTLYRYHDQLYMSICTLESFWNETNANLGIKIWSVSQGNIQ